MAWAWWNDPLDVNNKPRNGIFVTAVISSIPYFHLSAWLILSLLNTTTWDLEELTFSFHQSQYEYSELISDCSSSAESAKKKQCHRRTSKETFLHVRPLYRNYLYLNTFQDRLYTWRIETETNIHLALLLTMKWLWMFTFTKYRRPNVFIHREQNVEYFSPIPLFHNLYHKLSCTT